MPDAKSLLPGRAFRSEHAQLRPEPHSIASHGPAPMDPLQTTRMRNGVLYAAEWPCCHDPLRLSLGSEDPFYIFTTHAFGARGCAHPHPGGRARRARRVRAPPPRAGRRAPNPPPPSNPPACAPTRARGCLSAQAHKCVLPSTPPAQLIRVLLLYPRRAPNPPVRQRWQCVLHVRAVALQYRALSMPAHRVRLASAHPCRRVFPAAPPPPTTERHRRRAFWPGRCPQPSGGLHARRLHPAHSPSPAATPSPHTPYLS